MTWALVPISSMFVPLSRSMVKHASLSLSSGVHVEIASRKLTPSSLDGQVQRVVAISLAFQMLMQQQQKVRIGEVKTGFRRSILTSFAGQLLRKNQFRDSFCDFQGNQ